MSHQVDVQHLLPVWSRMGHVCYSSHSPPRSGSQGAANAIVVHHVPLPRSFLDLRSKHGGHCLVVPPGRSHRPQPSRRTCRRNSPTTAGAPGTGRYATSVTSIHYHGKTARGVSRAVLTDAPDEYERERLRQRALKLSFFKAARDITGVTPSWGALTGIRPGKLARAMLEQGKTERGDGPRPA